MKIRRSTFALCGMLVLMGTAYAQGNNPLITLNEFGQGTLVFPGGSPIPTTGVMSADPGPGGLASALTYNLLGPPGLVAGDLFLLETVGATVVLSDIIRFNPAGTSTGYPASAVFYSDNADGVDGIADTGFPVSFYTNTVTFAEVGPEGANGFTYTPTDGQPGFVPGFSVTYQIISDASVPEPATWSFMLIGAAGVGARCWRKRRA